MSDNVMKQARVSLVKSEDRRAGVFRALELVREDVTPRVRGTVVIKPNLGCGFIAKPAISTHPDALRGLLDFLGSLPVSRVVVAEGAPGTSEKFDSFGYRELEREYPVTLLDLNEETDWQALRLVDLRGKEHDARVSSTVVNADCRISVALPKTHDLVVTSLSLKNMMGSIRGRDREAMHGVRNGLWIYGRTLARVAHAIRRLSPSLVKQIMRSVARVQVNYNGLTGGSSDRRYLYAAGERPFELVARMSGILSQNLARMGAMIAPHVSVIDGVTGLEGEGPTHGDPVALGCVAAGSDFLAVDAVQASVMGFDPAEIEYLSILNRQGAGTADMASIDVIGASIAGLSRRFRPHPDYPGQRAWLSRAGSHEGPR